MLRQDKNQSEYNVVDMPVEHLADTVFNVTIMRRTATPGLYVVWERNDKGEWFEHQPVPRDKALVIATAALDKWYGSAP
jgi:hypothetical protein